MWSESRRVTDVAAALIWQCSARSQALTMRLSANGTSDMATKLLISWFNTVAHILTDGQPNDDGAPTIPQGIFIKCFRDFMIKAVNELVAKQHYALIAKLVQRTSLVESYLVELGEDKQKADAVGSICTALASCALILAGTETRMLASVQHGLPAWKKMPRVKADEIEAYLGVAPFLTLGVMPSIGKDDAWMVPDFREFDTKALTESARGPNLVTINAQLIEDAFYNQRYLVHPEGVYVKVTHAQTVTGVHIKVRSAERNALVDILARIETTQGAYFTLLTEERLLRPKNEAGIYPSIRDYGAYVVCQVYHDLVTQVDIPGYVEGTRKPYKRCSPRAHASRP